MTRFEEACLLLGIPQDRIGLVKRNQELKVKLDQRGEALLAVGKCIHDAHEHGGLYESCSRDNCAGIRELFEMTNP